MAKEKARKTRSIITGHLEKIGANVFDDYSSVITDLLRGHQGIYALYKKERLYYLYCVFSFSFFNSSRCQ